MRTIKQIVFFGFILLDSMIFKVKAINIDTCSRWSVRMAESVISKGSYQYISSYVAATAMKGFRSLWEYTADERYYEYITEAVGSDLSLYEGLSETTYHDIDFVNGGSLILFMYSETSDAGYLPAINSTYDFLLAFPRTDDGGFYHKDMPRMQVDDLYMACPFLAEYGKIFDEPEDYEDAVLQLSLMEEHTRNTLTGLYHHAWYETDWQGNPAGCTPIFWGRGMGWVAMALVDVLDYLPEDYTDRDSVIHIYQRLMEAVSNVQDDTAGVWWQVVDQGGREGNYLESSASNMFVYAIAKGVRLGYLDESYWEVVEKGYEGILNNFIRENPDGTISITNVCPGQSPGYHYENYVGGTGENMHAVGPFIRASLELETIGLPPSELKAVSVSGKQIDLHWKDNSDNEDGFIIERATDNEFIVIDTVEMNSEQYHDSTLTPLTNYKYRIRMYKGNKRSFWLNIVTATTLAENGAPAYATLPYPADKATSVDITTQLRWIPGAATLSHDVYFGNTDPPEFITNQADSIYSPDTLYNSTTYYWRIDEVNDAGTTTGETWSFTTLKAPGMVAYWTMDEGTDTIIHDESGFENDGILRNMGEDAWIQGIIGSTALQFDGIDDYVIVDHDESIDFETQSFSITFWLKQSETGTSMTYIEKKGYSIPGTPFGFSNGYKVYFDNLHREVSFLVDYSNTGRLVSVEDTECVTGEWEHITAVRDTISTRIKLYVNGNLGASISDIEGDLSQFTDLFIGFSHFEENTNFKGALDDIRIYNYALTDEEIQTIYSEGVPVVEEYINTQDNEFDLNIYPNPFSSNTTIQFSLSHKERVKLSVLNIHGQEIEVLLDKLLPKGPHTVEFDATSYPNGIYYYKLELGEYSETKSMIKIK